MVLAEAAVAVEVDIFGAYQIPIGQHWDLELVDWYGGPTPLGTEVALELMTDGDPDLEDTEDIGSQLSNLKFYIKKQEL